MSKSPEPPVIIKEVPVEKIVDRVVVKEVPVERNVVQVPKIFTISTFNFHDVVLTGAFTTFPSIRASTSLCPSPNFNSYKSSSSDSLESFKGSAPRHDSYRVFYRLFVA